MKYKFLYICLLFMTNVFYAQNNTDIFFSKASQNQYTNQDSTYFYINKIVDITQKNEAYIELIYALTIANKSASYFNNLKKLKTNLDLTDSIFKATTSHIKNHSFFSYLDNTIIYDRGTYQYMINNYDASKKEFETIISAIGNKPDTLLIKSDLDMMNGAYNFIAKMYSNEGKYDLAKQYYTKNIRFTTEKMPDEKGQLYRIYSLLGEVYKREQQPQKSNNYFITSLQYNIEHKGNTNRIVTEASNIIENHLALSQTDSARHYLSIMKSFLDENSPYLNAYYLDKAAVYEADKNMDSAIVSYKKALHHTKAKWNHQKHTDVADVYNDIANLYLKNNQPKLALENFESAINEVSGGLTTNSTINQTTLLKTLKNKAGVLVSNNTTEAYLNTIKTVNQSLTVLDSLKPTFKSEADKLLLMEDAFPLFESGIKSTYNLYQSSLDPSYIEQAFFYSEKSKNILLFEAILSTKATRFGTVPETLLEKEKQLKSEISSLEKKMNASKQVTDLLKDQLFQLKESHRQLIKTIETNHKAYYELKYNTQVSSLKTIQNNLQDDTVLISYFFGSNALYTISISKNSTGFKKVPLSDAYNESIIAVYKDISNPKSDVNALAKNTYDLYTSILKPTLTNYQNHKKLILIPDGLLNYIPFGSLNTKEDDIHYLIQDKTISYSNSATLFLQLLENKKNNNSLLAFAPSFSQTANSTLLPLPNNKKEAQAILSYFEGALFSGNQATLDNFTSENPKFGMLHLATHAIVDDRNPEFSYLAFEPESGKENLLYVSDLYNLNLEANLVTLSACESGIGNLKRGEGFMSLARGFYFSGASSIASTLWKINDGASSKIMDDFYLHLSKGKTKDVSLQQAKLNFIKDNQQNALSHPYYWSGFIISGNTTPIANTNYFIWILLGVTASIIIAAMFRRKKHS